MKTWVLTCRHTRHNAKHISQHPHCFARTRPLDLCLLRLLTQRLRPLLGGWFINFARWILHNPHYKFQIPLFEMSKLAVDILLLANSSQSQSYSQVSNTFFRNFKIGAFCFLQGWDRSPKAHCNTSVAPQCVAGSQLLAALWMNQSDTLGWTQASRYWCKGHHVPLQLKICSSKPRCSILIWFSSPVGDAWCIQCTPGPTKTWLPCAVFPIPISTPAKSNVAGRWHPGRATEEGQGLFDRSNGVGKGNMLPLFVEASRPRISEACFPCLNSCVVHIQVFAKDCYQFLHVSPLLQSYQILLHVARSAKLHVLSTCVLSRKKTRISMSQGILHRTRCLGPQLLIFIICF